MDRVLSKRSFSEVILLNNQSTLQQRRPSKAEDKLLLDGAANSVNAPWPFPRRNMVAGVPPAANGARPEGFETEKFQAFGRI